MNQGSAAVWKGLKAPLIYTVIKERLFGEVLEGPKSLFIYAVINDGVWGDLGGPKNAIHLGQIPLMYRRSGESERVQRRCPFAPN